MLTTGRAAPCDPYADCAAPGDLLHLHDLADLFAGGIRDDHELSRVGLLCCTGHSLLSWSRGRATHHCSDFTREAGHARQTRVCSRPYGDLTILAGELRGSVAR